MQTATSETESKSRDLSICVHHYTLRAPCPQGQGKESTTGPLCWRNWAKVQYVSSDSAHLNIETEERQLLLLLPLRAEARRIWSCS